jgi:hypothetical protein
VEVLERPRGDASAPVFAISSVLASCLRVTCGSAVRERNQVSRGVKIQEYGRGRDTPERGQADVNLQDEVARDAHGRAVFRVVRAGGDCHSCGVWRANETEEKLR